MDMCFDITLKIKSMKYSTFDTSHIKTVSRKMKNNKTAGPDNVKPEMFKAVAESDICLEAIRSCFQQLLDGEEKVGEWEKSRTKILKEKEKPMAADLKPVALTNISYKLYMALIKKT